MKLFNRDGPSPKYLSIVAVAAVIILISFFPAYGAPLADYKSRIERARSACDKLFETLNQADEFYERNTVAEIENLLPATEKIEWAGGSVETGNEWVKIKLTEFTAIRDTVKRAAILNEISERLLAISGSINEMEQAAEASQSKDEEKQKLAEILRREQFQKPRASEESLFQKWLREFLDWLARSYPGSPSVPSAAPGTGSLQYGLQILIYALVIALLGFLIYKFAPFFSDQFGTRSKRMKKDRVILGERVGADESASDLFTEAEQLARDGNLRAAIRKGYIALLCDLSDRKILRLARHKTNRDYMRDVQKTEGLFKNMTGLTRNFEDNWYGLKAADQADWEDFRDGYQQAIKSVGRQGQNREQ